MPIHASKIEVRNQRGGGGGRVLEGYSGTAERVYLYLLDRLFSHIVQYSLDSRGEYLHSRSKVAS